MAIEKINFSYPKGSLQSVFDTEEMTALELASKTSKKVDECVELVNGVEQSAIEATAVVDQMKIEQEQFMTESADIRGQLIIDNQAYIDTLNDSKDTFDATMNTALTTTENNMNTALTTFQGGLNTSKTAFEADMTNTLNDFEADTTASKTTYETGLNTSKTAFETSMTNTLNSFNTTLTTANGELSSLQTAHTNLVNTVMPTEVSNKINAMVTSGEMDTIVNDNVLGAVNTKITAVKAITDKFEKGLPSTPSFNSTPNDGKVVRFIHGDDTNPTLDGTTPSVYIQRVDKSVTLDDPGHLIPALYTVFHRKTGGTGWLYSNLSYLQDDSNSGNAQSVSCAGMAYATNKSAVWGIYGDAYSMNSLATITGAEFDAQNYSGVDYAYNEANPVGVPFSCAIWNMSFGTKNNSFGIGIGGGGASKWGAGIFIGLSSCKKYAIDIQSTAQTLINFKYGATVNGDNGVFAGIGLDTGSGAYFTTESGSTRQNTGAIHLRNHRLCFGNGGWLHFNSVTGQLQIGITDSSGVDTVWASIGTTSGWTAGGTAQASLM